MKEIMNMNKTTFIEKLKNNRLPNFTSQDEYAQSSRKIENNLSKRRV